MDGELARTTFHPLRLHRIYRLRLERDGRGVRLITRGGYNFADRYPWIVEATLKIHEQQHDRRCDGQGADSNYKGINFFVIPHAAAYSGGNMTLLLASGT